MNDDAGVYAFAFFIGAVISLISTLQMSQTYHQRNIIERGYGLYCPTDGDFAFIGECIE